MAPLELAASDGTRTASEDLSRWPLAIRGLTVSYGDKPVVFSVDASFEPGAMTAIVGPNGAGKSSLLKAALGIVRPLSGQVTVHGESLELRRSQIAYVPQRASVEWDFPVRAIDVVLMGLWRELGLLRLVGRGHRARAMDALSRVGMEDFAERQIGQLSGGQQQRVFLARALVQGAGIYLLDEPFAGVDAATEKAIIGVLQGLRDDGNTIIAVHHDLATLHTYFDRALLLNVRRIAEGLVEHAATEETLAQTYGGRLAMARIDPDTSVAS